MQWSADAHAGFTTGTPWLPVADDYVRQNAQAASIDPSSSLSLYRALGRLRSGSDALKRGKLQVVDCSNIDVLGYVCSYPGDDTYVVCINFSEELARCRLPVSLELLVLSSDSESQVADVLPGADLSLLPHEAVVCRIPSV